jgi:Protein of unknown function (DUF2795)
VQKALGGVSYPANKDQLIKHAQEHGASQDAIDALRALPDKQYDGPNEVSAEVAHA